MRVACFIALLALCQSAVAVAHAQTSTPPDIVRLHDGSFLRGTIVERTPSEVVLMLPTGEVRRIPADDVASADPGTNGTAGQPASTTPAETGVQLRVRSDQQGLTLHRLTGSGQVQMAVPGGVGVGLFWQFVPLCSPPCGVAVPRGTYRLGVSSGAGNPILAGPPMNLRHDTALDIGYEDRSGLRIAGWLAMTIGALAGAGLVTASFFIDESDEPYGGFVINYPLLVTGAVVEIASIAVGIALVLLGDVAHVESVGPEGIRF